MKFRSLSSFIETFTRRQPEEKIWKWKPLILNKQNRLSLIQFLGKNNIFRSKEFWNKLVDKRFPLKFSRTIWRRNLNKFWYFSLNSKWQGFAKNRVKWYQEHFKSRRRKHVLTIYKPCRKMDKEKTTIGQDKV